MRASCTESDCSKPAFGRGLCSSHYQKARYHGELPTTPPDRDCEQCGNRFSTRKWNARYCSRTCNDRARQDRRSAEAPRIVEACRQCGASLDGRRKDAQFCSDKCLNDFHNGRRSTAKRELLLANRKPCAGCGNKIPDQRGGKAAYCSWDCRIRSRRHETYGLTKAELDVLLAQHEKCAICASGSWGKKGPQVDHDHATGKVRGVLCINCNNGLGRFGDDPERLRAAAAYVEAHR